VSTLESTPLKPVRYSLQSRDLIADQVETAAGGHWLDGMVVIPGCDKNMPGTLIALGRLNRPGMMVYGGTIRPGQCGGNGGPPEVVDIVSAFQSYGRYLQEGQTEAAEKTRYETVRNACPGAGACGGVGSQLSTSLTTDVHRKHHGLGHRGPRHVSSRLLILPGGIPRQAR
jgi:dihydroxy-acid dehydratase